MKDKKWLGEALILLVVLAPLVYLATVWNSLPEQVPLHWNIKGETDNYGSKWELLFVLGGMQLFTYLLFLLLPKIAAKRNNIKLMGSNFYKMRLLMQVFISSLFVIILLASADIMDISVNTMIASVLAIFMLLFGNYMTSIRPNYFMGIRTPWTLANEKVWKKTHLLGGRLWVLAGIFGLLSLLILPNQIAFGVVIGLMVVPMLIASIYSFILFKKLTHQ